MKNLFLDDIRVPGDVTWLDIRPPGASPWHVVRSFDQAVNWVLTNGFPDHVSFDHDLGEDDEKTGHDFAKWLIAHDINTGTMPEYFSFTVHSKNPVGAVNIQKLIENYLNFKKDDK